MENDFYIYLKNLFGNDENTIQFIMTDNLPRGYYRKDWYDDFVKYQLDKFNDTLEEILNEKE